MRLLLLLLILAPLTAHSAYYEVGFAGNYRKLFLPSDDARESFDSTVSYTGSFAYYFAEMAAAELSFTKGQSERFVASQAVDSRTTYDFSLIGLDLIFTFADRKSDFIPYVKAGLAYFAEKKVSYEFIDNTSSSVTRPEPQKLDPTYVPSLGLGVKFRITERLAFKIGMEAWTSDSLSSDPKWDMAGRAGISWFL